MQIKKTTRSGTFQQTHNKNIASQEQLLPIDQIICGDAVKVMRRQLPDNSIHAIVTDPPYGLEFMGEEWDKFKKTGHSHRHGFDRPHSERDIKNIKGIRVLPRFIQNNKDLLNYQEWTTLWATEAFRVLKPGGTMFVMGGTRTYHRMACGVEDAGFQIKDTLLWNYLSGFPKAQDLGKLIDKKLGAERKVIGKAGWSQPAKSGHHAGLVAKHIKRTDGRYTPDVTAPATPLAKKWNGWKVGTLKPSFEPVIWAIKPFKLEHRIYILAHTIIENVCQSLNAVSFAEKNSELSHFAQELSIALWNVISKAKHSRHISGLQQTTHSRESEGRQPQIGKEADTNSNQDTLESGLIKTVTDLNTTSLWRNILVAISSQTRTFTTETATALITDLRILSFLLSQSIPLSTTEVKTLQDGEVLFANNVEDISRSVLAKLRLLNTIFAQENVRGKQRERGSTQANADSRPIVWAVKPPEGSWTNNVLKHGVGAINVDGCRILYESEDDRESRSRGVVVDGKDLPETMWNIKSGFKTYDSDRYMSKKGRYPANMIRTDRFGDGYDKFYFIGSDVNPFIFVPKASRTERDEGLDGLEPKQVMNYGHKENPGRKAPKKSYPHRNIHPTVKPVRLMEHLIKLVTRGGKSFSTRSSALGQPVLLPVA